MRAARPTWVFLHGFMGSGSDWQHIATKLAAQGQTVLVLDLPGHNPNNSDLASVATLSFAWLCDWLHHKLTAAGLNQPAAVRLVGYSLGGRLALAAASQKPHWLHSLVLESASPGISDPAARQTRAALDEQRAEQLRRAGLDAFLQYWYAQPLFASLQAQPALYAAVLARRQQHDPIALARVLAELSPGKQPSLWQALPTIAQPTLLLAGALDPTYIATLQTAQPLLAAAQLSIIPAAGHNCHLEQPNAFLLALQHFASAFP